MGTSAFKGLLKRRVFSSGPPGKEGFYKMVTVSKLLLASMLLFAFGSTHRRFDGSFKYRGYGGLGFNYYSARQTLAEVLSSSPSNKDPTVAEGKDPLVPNKLRQAPPITAQVFWPSSRTFATPGAAIDAINMVDRPKMTWNADPESYYFIMAVDEGIPRIQTAGLVYVHWLVTNVPGDKVYAGDEVDQYVPPFSYKFNEAGDGVVEDGTPLHAILFLVYKQPGRIDFEGGQWGCEPNLGMRVANKEELSEKYGLGQPLAANMIYTKYSPAGTDYLFCKFTRCGANPRGGPFPIPLPGINDGAECQPQ